MRDAAGGAEDVAGILSVPYQRGGQLRISLSSHAVENEPIAVTKGGNSSFSNVTNVNVKFFVMNGYVQFLIPRTLTISSFMPIEFFRKRTDCRDPCCELEFLKYCKCQCHIVCCELMVDPQTLVG